MRLLLTLIVSFGLLLPTSLAQPAHIIIIRHAEKPTDPDDKNLSDIGRRHARALVKLFAENAELTKLGRPVAIFATALGKGGKGQRCQQTVAPLAETWKLPVQTPFKAEENAALAKQILADEKLRNKSVLICWTKERIPELMRALGVAEPPPKLAEDEYDKIFILSPQAEGMKVRVMKQNLAEAP